MALISPKESSGFLSLSSPSSPLFLSLVLWSLLPVAKTIITIIKIRNKKAAPPAIKYFFFIFWKKDLKPGFSIPIESSFIGWLPNVSDSFSVISF